MVIKGQKRKMSKQMVVINNKKINKLSNQNSNILDEDNNNKTIESIDDEDLF